MIDKNSINIEKITNGIFILAALIAIGIIINKNFFSSNEPIQKIEINQKISFPAIDWGKNNKTIILAVRKDCPFCKGSESYFKDIFEKASAQNIVFELLSTDSEEESKNNLPQLNNVEKFHKLSLGKYGFVATPTILFVDRDGVVKDLWIGAIDSNNSVMLLNKLDSFITGNSPTTQLSSMMDTETKSSLAENRVAPNTLRNMLNLKQEVLVIDVDTRDEYRKLHIKNAKNIPSDEITVRASREIAKNKQIVFYGRCPKDSVSSATQAQLKKMGYSNVLFLEGGLKTWKDLGFPVEKVLEVQ